MYSLVLTPKGMSVAMRSLEIISFFCLSKESGNLGTIFP